MTNPDATVATFVEKGTLRVGTMTDDDDTTGKLTLSYGWSTMNLSWSDSDWAFTVHGTEMTDQGTSYAHACTFGYDTELGGLLSQRIGESV